MNTTRAKLLAGLTTGAMTYEDAAALLHAHDSYTEGLEKKTEELKKRNRELQARNAELEARHAQLKFIINSDS